MNKKLEGNGLWESSRMMLPQHREQSMEIRSDTPPPSPGPATNKEMEMMRDYIILPVALKIVEKNSVEVAQSAQMLKLVYAAAAKILVKRIRADVQKSKKLLIEKNIRVFEHAKDDSELIYRYICRGHEDRLVMTKDFMRAEISARIGTYARGLVTMLQEAATAK
jgi:hypothetical protein